MGFGSYLRTRFGEAIFCCIAAASLTYTAFSGFYACQPLQVWPWIAGVAGACAILTFILYAIAYRAKTAVIGSIAVFAIMAGLLAICVSLGPGETLLDDVEGNYTVALALLCSITVLVFLASRRRVGSVILLVAGVMLCCLIEYLYWYGHLIALLLFLVGSTGLIVFRGYQRNLIVSDSDKLAFTSVSLTALVLAVLSLGVAFATFFLVIEPLDPPSRQITLLVEHRSQEEVEIRGTGSTSSDKSSNSGNLANGEQEESNQEASDNLFDTVQASVAEMLGMDQNQTGDEGTTTAMVAASIIAVVIIGILLLLVALTILIKKRFRLRRYRKMVSGSNEDTVRALYLFFLDRFKRMKIPRPEHLSPSAYAHEFSATFREFEGVSADTRSAFALLTDVYSEAVYGHVGVDDAQVSLFKDYYRMFYRNARRYVGGFKYLIAFFRL